MKVKIIVDSTSDFSDELRQQLDMVPLTVYFGEEAYLDGVEMDHRGFYEKLASSDVLPTTSQATPYAFQQVFSQAVAQGFEVVAVTISGKLSGTYQSACIAAEEFPGKVFVVDSGSVSIGSGILVEYAEQLAQQGLPAAEIAEKLTEKRGDIRVIALLDTLEYLQKGGRISKTVAFAGGLLSIKPIICIADGEISLIGKIRGSKQGASALVSEIEKLGGADFSMPIQLGYTGLNDGLMKKYAEDSRQWWGSALQEMPSTGIGSVVGTHAGPGAVGWAFFRKHETK